MDTCTSTETSSPYRHAVETLAAERLRAPATIANIARNAGAQADRQARWAGARDALWSLISGYLPVHARVAILGAGNGDDLPLERIAGRASEVSLLDLDVRVLRRARRRQPRRLRRRMELVELDVTGGAADQLAIAAATGELPAPPVLSDSPLPGAPYDVVIGDLLYSQLLYPALLDLQIPATRVTAFLARYSQVLTRSAVARLHASAPHGVVVHAHDPLAWGSGRPQPVTLERILATAARDPDAALRLAAHGTGPHHSDPRRALEAFAIPISATALWRWPFGESTDYLVCASLTDARAPE